MTLTNFPQGLVDTIGGLLDLPDAIAYTHVCKNTSRFNRVAYLRRSGRLIKLMEMCVGYLERLDRYWKAAAEQVLQNTIELTLPWDFTQWHYPFFLHCTQLRELDIALRSEQCHFLTDLTSLKFLRLQPLGEWIGPMWPGPPQLPSLNLEGPGHEWWIFPKSARTSLQHLSCHGPRAEWIERLPSYFPSLRSLALRHPHHFTDREQLSHAIRQLPHLTCFELRGMAVFASLADALGGCRSLHLLVSHKTSGLRVLEKVLARTCLQSLTLDVDVDVNWNIEGSFAQVAKDTRVLVERLRIESRDVHIGFPRLHQLANKLRPLALKAFKLTLVGLPLRMFSYRGLRAEKLSIHGCYQLEGGEGQALGESVLSQYFAQIPQLTKVKLCGIASDAVSAVSRLPALTSLSLCNMELGEGALRAIVRALPALKELDFAGRRIDVEKWKE